MRKMMISAVACGLGGILMAGCPFPSASVNEEPDENHSRVTQPTETPISRHPTTPVAVFVGDGGDPTVVYDSGGDVDSDGDGLIDFQEVAFSSDPNDPLDPLAYFDTDRDGWSDWDELKYGSDPADQYSTP